MAFPDEVREFRHLHTNSHLIIRYPLTLTDWIGVLAVSNKYCIKNGMDQASSLLKQGISGIGETQFNPYYALRLAWEFNLEDWYEDTIRTILNNPFFELTTQDVRDIEPKITAIVLSVRMRCHRHRLDLIPYTPEMVHDPSCRDQAACASDWRTAYSSATFVFAQTRKYYSGREVYQELNSMEIPSIREDCRRLTLDEIESKGVLWREEHFIEKAFDAIKSVLVNERPYLPRPNPRYISTNDHFSIL